MLDHRLAPLITTRTRRLIHLERLGFILLFMALHWQVIADGDHRSLRLLRVLALLVLFSVLCEAVQDRLLRLYFLLLYRAGIHDEQI